MKSGEGQKQTIELRLAALKLRAAASSMMYTISL